MESTPQSVLVVDDVLDPFFCGESGYCSLLQALLRSNRRLAREFRLAFFERVLGPRFGVVSDGAPLAVDREVIVSHEEGKTQAIDLVIRLDGVWIGIEVKVAVGSHKAGQLAAQYRGLRQQADKDAPKTTVYALYVFPRKTQAHRDVEAELPDKASSVTWKEIFDCFPPPPGPTSEVILSNLLARANARFPAPPVLKTNPTTARLAVAACLDQVVSDVQMRLAGQSGTFEGSGWQCKRYQSPGLEQRFGPLSPPGPRLHASQYLDVSVHFGPDYRTQDLEPGPDFQRRVSAGVRLKGTNRKRYNSQAAGRFPVLRAGLPAALGERRTDSLSVLDWLDLDIAGSSLTIAARPAHEVLADLLWSYAENFRQILLASESPAGT